MVRSGRDALCFRCSAVYVESCSMFVRGGVYGVVKEALGGTLAKLSVSALMFDYILAGPVSGVSAGQYIAGLINDTSASPTLMAGSRRRPPPLSTARRRSASTAPPSYSRWRSPLTTGGRHKGIEESSEKALWVMQITTVMVVMLLGWPLFHLVQGRRPPAAFPDPRQHRLQPRNHSASGNIGACRTLSPHGLIIGF